MAPRKGCGVRQAAGRVQQQPPFPVMWKPSFKPGWMEKCLGLAARPERPDVCREQSFGDGVRLRAEGRLEKSPSLPLCLQAYCSFPSLPTRWPALFCPRGKWGLPPAQVLRMVTPLQVLHCIQPQFLWWPAEGWARRGAGGRLHVTDPRPLQWFPLGGERDREEVSRGQGWETDHVGAKTLAHRHATLGIRESAVGMGRAGRNKG